MGIWGRPQDLGPGRLLCVEADWRCACVRVEESRLNGRLEDSGDVRSLLGCGCWERQTTTRLSRGMAAGMSASRVRRTTPPYQARDMLQRPIQRAVRLFVLHGTRLLLVDLEGSRRAHGRDLVLRQGPARPEGGSGGCLAALFHLLRCQGLFRVQSMLSRSPAQPCFGSCRVVHCMAVILENCCSVDGIRCRPVRAGKLAKGELHPVVPACAFLLPSILTEGGRRPGIKQGLRRHVSCIKGRGTLTLIKSGGPMPDAGNGDCVGDSGRRSR